MSDFVMDVLQIKNIDKKISSKVGNKRFRYQSDILTTSAVFEECGCGAGGTCASSCVSGCAERGSCCSYGPK